MKKINITIFSILIIIIFGFTSCSTTKSLSNGKNIDKRLVGIWTGFENDDQVKGMRKEWEMIRNNDGTFVLDFKAITSEETQEFIEKGTWWIEKGQFFEYHSESDKTDIYNYEVLNKNEIRFTMIKSAVDFNNPDYTFIDKRKKKEITKKKTKDGSSIESAIKVRNVSQEYAYIKKVCEGCQLLGQSLLFEKKKPYDKITVKTIDGKEVSYYFDISSFYGKF